MNKVIVLLSTYNGEKFLEEQINSILHQKFVDVKLLIRDDGSTDKTLEILNKYSKFDKIKIISGSNIGWKKSFNELLSAVKMRTDSYYAFADQDDVWLQDKLFQAVEKIKDYDVPALYHSNVSITDTNLNVLHNRYDELFSPSRKLPESFFNGYGVGSTMVFNNKLLSLIQEYKPTEATNHDALAIQLANLTGISIYDKNSYILYRRHAGATTGFGTSKISTSPSLIDRYKKYKKGPKNQFSIRAQQILKGYSKYLSSNDKKFFQWVASYQSNFLFRMCLLFSFRIKASGFRKTMQIKYRIIFNTL